MQATEHPVTLRGQPLERAAIVALAGMPRTLVDCDLEGVDLSRLDLAGWCFDTCNLRRADLRFCRLDSTHWLRCRGAGADLTGADLANATFDASDFNNASFKTAALDEAMFVRCKLTGADFSDIKAIDLSFEETLLVGAKIPGRVFSRRILKTIDFAQADLRKCDFRMAVMEDCSFRDALLDEARFEGADLRGADLGGVRLEDAGRFRGATISKDQAAQLLGSLGLRIA